MAAPRASVPGRAPNRTPGRAGRSQLALPLDWGDGDDPRAAEAGFLVGASNAVAVRHLEHHATWPVRTSVLTGPSGSGKTMLARLFARATGATVIDPVAGTADATLFHAWNAAQDSRRPLLLVADAPPAHWPVALPDLRSRLMAAPVVAIDEPDDCLAQSLIAALFARRATPVAPELAAYLVPRIERSYAAIHAVVAAIDAASIAHRRRIGIRLAREILAEQGWLAAPRAASPPVTGSCTGSSAGTGG